MYQSAVGTVAVAIATILLVGYTTAEIMLPAADKDFLLTTEQCDLSEVKLGKLASQKGQRADVKTFGRLMAEQHAAMNLDLATVAMQKGVVLPGLLDVKHRELVVKFMILDGEEFDNAYISEMLKSHKKFATDLKAEAAETKDPDIKSFVDKYIPVADKHLHHITIMKQ